MQHKHGQYSLMPSIGHQSVASVVDDEMFLFVQIKTIKLDLHLYVAYVYI